jgi:cell division protein DivIC
MINYIKNIDSIVPFLKKGLTGINKYIIVVVLFLIFMLFIAEKDVFSSFSQRKKLNTLQKSEQHLSKQIAETQKELDLLRTNAETIEKYARENYLMKKDNEDIFIITNSAESK